MSVFQVIYTVLIRPLQIFFEYVFSVAQKGLNNPGLSIIALSLSMNLLVLPLYNRADAVQEEERNIENKLRKGVAHIRKTFKGDERMMMLQTYYRQNGYKPTDVFKSSVSLLLEIPFFIAAYQFLSHLDAIQNVSFGPIANLGAPDALITIGAFSINLLPIVMTSLNLISCIVFTKGYPLKNKIQLYAMAVFFFFFLYKSPAGLVFYWTLNNLFSLVKTIYYKSKTAKKVLNIAFSAVGVCLLGSLPFVMKKTGSKSFLLILVLLAFICFVPFVISIVSKKEIFKKKEIKETDGKLFLLGGIYMTLLTGILIPSAVIKSSPQEFVDIYHFLNPLWFVLSATCIAAGLFLVWFSVFYGLLDKKIKSILNVVMCVVCFVATVNYMFFGKNNVILNSALAYTEEYSAPHKLILINLAVIVLVVAAGVALTLLLGKKLRVLLIAGTLAIFGMSVINCGAIQKEIKSLKLVIESVNTEKPSFNFSKNGKNVIVFMLDRGMNEYIPYFVNEKPELKETYDGFTYYPNTISYGLCTNYGAPAIFGGYEYTPEEMNKRDTELLRDKNDEALKVMPALFYEQGYNVTVCDPPYAGYSTVPDLSIYNDYPGMKTFITKGYYWNAQKVNVSDRNFRNFFCYSITKIAPLAIQNHLYNHGSYNESIGNERFLSEMKNSTAIVKDGLYRCTGINEEVMEDYLTIANLIDMTEISDDASDNFLMIDNELTHWPIYFKEPEYEVAYYVDNEGYEKEHADRYTIDGVTLDMNNDVQIGSYQVNMCAMLRIGEWLDYLKEQGVYDNTRIIIVSDHGKWLYHNDMFDLDGSGDDETDIESYYPLLMVKDFNSHGFTTNEQFMTNGDVPVYALDGIVENPVNPFTGNPITNDAKEGPQKILGSHNPDVITNNGTTFIDGIWFSVEGDMRDKNNWKILEDNR